MHIKGIIFSALIFGLSLPVLAMECPADNPLVDHKILCQDGRDKNGNPVGGCNPTQECRSCNYARGVETTKNNCNRCPNREFVDGLCILKNCPDNFFIAGEECMPCDTTLPSGEWATQQECSKCPYRVFKNDHCIFNPLLQYLSEEQHKRKEN